jgi:ABC-type bacteriocin/lantibiotic exporter with double-glycine peptidase domain
MKKLIEVPHLVQYYNIDDEIWQGRSCGIVSLAMIFDYYDVKFDLAELIQQGLDADGYIDGVGWKHDAIVDLAKKHGFESRRVEAENLESLTTELNSDRPVIISIHKNFDEKEGGHLAVLNGYFESEGKIEGFYVNDPIGAQYKHKNQFIPAEKFLVGWKKRAIYIKKPER